MDLGGKQFDLVTGAGGVLGGAVCEALRAAGRNVVCASRKKGWEETIPDGTIAAIVHCAFARSSDGAELAQSIDYALEVFRFAAKRQAERLVNISSQSVYGADRAMPSKETDAVAPIDAYAVAKYACEKLADEICVRAGVRVAHARLASLIGAQYPERLVSKMAKYALESGKVTVQGGGQKFAFMNLRDAVAGLSRIVLSPNALTGVFNLCTAESKSLAEIAQIVASTVEQATGKRITVETAPGDSAFSRMCDVSKMQRMASWVASVSFDDSVREIVGSLSKG